MVLALACGALGSVAAPAAHADTFCDLSPDEHGVNIDFTRPTPDVNAAASQLLPFFTAVGKALPVDAPKAVRSYFASFGQLVAQATTVRARAELRRLAARSLALSSSKSGRAALAWITKRCAAPDPQDPADPATLGRSTGKAATASPPASGTSGSGTLPAGAIDPCRLVTRTEATAALGADPGAAVRQDSRTCIYGPGFSDPTKSTLWAAIVPIGGKRLFAVGLGETRPLDEGEYREVIGGLGDAALKTGKSGDNGDISEVAILKGDTMVEVTILSPGGAARTQVMTPARIASMRI